MRFNLESGTPAVADIDNAGVLARGYDDAFAGGGQTAQMNARGFIRAVLRPHHREDTQLRERGLAAHERLDTLKLFRSEIVSGDYRGSDWFHKKVMSNE